MRVRHLDYGSWLRPTERWINKAELLAALEGFRTNPQLLELDGREAVECVIRALQGL